ncbi:MAG TPA: hypothetical protein VG758_34155 [Hyphomicrobiaceae bacterium]|jgi:hypothetical protein|nr:hypothetical protein [Hyphomicrobiaceae bacterium]
MAVNVRQDRRLAGVAVHRLQHHGRLAARAPALGITVLARNMRKGQKFRRWLAEYLALERKAKGEMG